MAALQIHGLPRVKENPTVLMRSQDTQSPAKQIVPWAQSKNSSATRKVAGTQGRSRPPPPWLSLALCCCPAHTPHANQIPPHRPIPNLVSAPAYSWSWHTGSRHLGNARPFFPSVPVSFSWQNLTAKKLSGFVFGGTSSPISQYSLILRLFDLPSPGVPSQCLIPVLCN